MKIILFFLFMVFSCAYLHFIFKPCENDVFKLLNWNLPPATALYCDLKVLMK